MGYKLVQFLKTNKEAFAIVLLQMLVVVGGIYFILNWPIILFLIPILNALIVYMLYKNISNPKKLILTWLATCFLLVVGLIYMGVRNSFLGISLLVFLHLYGFTVPYFFALFIFG